MVRALRLLFVLSLFLFSLPFCAAGGRELSLVWYMPFPSAVQHVEEALYTLHPEDPGAFSDIAVSNDASMVGLACAKWRCTSGAEFLDLGDGTRLTLGGAHFPERLALAGEALAVGLEGRRAFVYNVSGGSAALVSSFETELKGAAVSFEVSRNARYVLLADRTNLRLFSPSGAELLEWHYGSGELLGASVSDAGNVVVVGDAAEGREMLLMNDEGRLLWKKPVNLSGRAAAALSADGRRIALGVRDEWNEDFALYLYDGNGEPLSRFEVEAGVAEVALSRDGGVAVVRPYERKGIEVLDTEGGKAESYYTYSYPLHVSISAGGDSILVSDLGYYGGSARTRWSRVYLLNYSQMPAAPQAARKRVAVVANEVDLALASPLVDLLEGEGVEVVRADLSEPRGFTGTATVLILGGPDAGGGVGGLVSSLLFRDEEEYLRGPGRRMKFVHTDVWSDDQRVFVLAGSDRWQTREVWMENLADIARQAVR